MIIIIIRLDSQQNQLQFIVDFLHFSLWFFFSVFSFFGLSSIDLRMTITVRIFESLPVSGPQSFIHCPFLDLFCIFRLFFFSFVQNFPTTQHSLPIFQFFLLLLHFYFHFFRFVQNFPATQHDAAAPRDWRETGYWIVLPMLQVPFVLKRQLLSLNFMHSPENKRLKCKRKNLLSHHGLNQIFKFLWLSCEGLSFPFNWSPFFSRKARP